MKYTNGVTIKTLTSEDGAREVDLVARCDGLFQWHENIWVDGDQFSGPHWEPSQMSGLYATKELAERDVAELPWLRGEIGS